MEKNDKLFCSVCGEPAWWFSYRFSRYYCDKHTKIAIDLEIPEPNIPRYECEFCGNENIPPRGVIDHVKAKHPGISFHLALVNGIGRIQK